MAKASSIVVAGLESALVDIRRRHRELPEVVVALAGSRRKWGHYAHDRWVRGDGKVAELFVAGEGLRQGTRFTLTVLLHESAHGLAAVRGVQDTSRNGGYHNRRYKALAEEVGLEAGKAGSRGWSDTKLPDATFDSYASTVVKLEKALSIWRQGEQAARPPSRNLAVAVCGCERRIRVAPKVYEEGPIVCGRCGSVFTVTAPVQALAAA